MRGKKPVLFTNVMPYVEEREKKANKLFQLYEEEHPTIKFIQSS